MLDGQLIEELKCALSDEEHFVIKPIALSCGHSIYQNCIPAEVNEPEGKNGCFNAFLWGTDTRFYGLITANKTIALFAVKTRINFNLK